ncbi:MAG: hypothetical protein HYR73_07680 [Candidatus Eisenbacteria bacterium]|nr:hypothetical protein [Candidatus Eisenbacteria bacterium]
MTENTHGVRNQRGIALIVALLVLLVLSMLAAILMMSINTDTKIAGHSSRSARALNDAESGVAEVCALLISGDLPSDGANPRMTGQVFLVPAGSVPTPGNTDSTFTYTRQPSGAWLNYSSASRGPDVLTVKYLTDAAQTVVYKYDETKPQPVNTVSGLPIMVITATGHAGMDMRKIQVEVIQKPVIATIKAALAANVSIAFLGNAVVCGYNHSGDTPTGSPAETGSNGRGNAPDCLPWETLGGDLPGSWTTGTTTNGGAAGQSGFPVPNLSAQTGFYAGPWEALSMTQAQFTSWIGPPVASPSTLNAIVYVDNNGVMGDKSASLGLHGASGEGMLYVDGDLTINAGFVYRGLIYVEGDLKMNGTAWVLGGIIVSGVTQIKQNGGATLLYSSDAITRAISKYGGQYTTLAWKEL